MQKDHGGRDSYTCPLASSSGCAWTGALKSFPGRAACTKELSPKPDSTLEVLWQAGGAACNSDTSQQAEEAAYNPEHSHQGEKAACISKCLQ